MVARQPDIDALRQQVLAEFNVWAGDLEAGKITDLDIKCRGYGDPASSVRSQGYRDPSHRPRFDKGKS